MIATEKAQHAATGKRGLILSRSTFVSSGHYGGHWLGDNSARWIDLRASIIGIQEFNLFGMPYIGADICGFNGETTEELCLRWQQLGAFYPFSRNHNEKGVTSQDPSRWPDVARATRNANLFRYYYLPYLYSLLFDVSLYGGTVIRPVFFEFTSDSETHDLGEQFMWGNAMMIIPVYQPGATSVSGYLPSAIWYSLRDSDYGTLIKSGHNEFRAPRDELIPVFVKGPGKSTGMLYWYDGESIVKDFTTYNYFYWLFEFVLNADTAIMYITSNCTADYFTMASVSATNELSTISDGDDLRTYVVYNDERRNVNSIIGLYPLINYSVQNNDNIDRLPFFGIRQCLQLQNAYKNYGMVRTIKAVLLGHKNSTVYVLILKNGADEAQNWSKLPTVSLYPDEDEIDGMKRLLVQVMGLTEESAEAICKVRHVVAKWWRPNFEKEIYPYIPSHITKPKEMIKLIAVNLPKSAVFTIPKNSLLIAAPLFEIYDNVNEYGAIIANLPHVLGRFEFIYNP
ncbi:Glycosyl hydrolases 31 family protein [Acanthocheilonema viteae]